MLIVIVILSSMIISRFGLRTKPLSIVYLAAVLAAFRFETILVRRFAHFSSASLFSAHMKFGLSFISLTTPRAVVMSCGSVTLLNPTTDRTRGLLIYLLA